MCLFKQIFVYNNQDVLCIEFSIFVHLCYNMSWSTYISDAQKALLTVWTIHFIPNASYSILF